MMSQAAIQRAMMHLIEEGPEKEVAVPGGARSQSGMGCRALH
jgi:hypothetical protein